MQCDAVALFGISILILFAILFLPIVLYALHTFINEKKEPRTKLNKLFEIIFLLSTTTVVILIVILAFNPCNIYSEVAFVRLHLYCGGFFLVQAFTTLLLFYNKLLRIFDGTVYGISKWTKRAYAAIFIILATLQVIWLLLTIFSDIIKREIAGLIFLIILCLLLTVIMNISMVILFTSKLIKTIQNVVRRNPDYSATGSNSSCNDNTEEDDRLIGAISKLTVLTTISLVSTFANYVWQNVADTYVEKGTATHGMWIAVTYIWMLDLFTNFLCIVLCYQSFKTYYLRLCGCMDMCCRKTVSKTCVTTAKVNGKDIVDASKTRARSVSNND